jgi:hypothetical protein
MSLFTAGSYTSLFYHVLTTPAGSIPKGAQWIVAFEDLNNSIIKKGITTAMTYENKPWAISKAADVVASDVYQKWGGCMFCQAIDMPGEGTAVVPEGNIQSNAWLRSYVGAGRNQFPEMRVSFLDTNVSFVDNVCRPWSIATATFGLLAQPRFSEKNYRTNMYCWKIAPYEPGDGPKVTMLMTFYDICCVSVNNEELNYQPSTAPMLREAQFVYNYYSVNTEKDSSFLSNQGKTTSTENLGQQ